MYQSWSHFKVCMIWWWVRMMTWTQFNIVLLLFLRKQLIRSAKNEQKAETEVSRHEPHCFLCVLSRNTSVSVVLPSWKEAVLRSDEYTALFSLYINIQITKRHQICLRSMLPRLHTQAPRLKRLPCQHQPISCALYLRTRMLYLCLPKEFFTGRSW